MRRMSQGTLLQVVADVALAVDGFTRLFFSRWCLLKFCTVNTLTYYVGLRADSVPFNLFSYV